MALSEIIPWQSQRQSLAPRHDPITDFQQQFNRAFEELFGSSRSFTPAERPFFPPVEIIDAHDEVRIRAELPGIDPKDLEINVTNDSIIIRGEKRQERSAQEEGVQFTERFFGSFERAIPLPNDVDSEKVKAELKNGVLEIKIPKRGDVKSRAHRVQIE